MGGLMSGKYVRYSVEFKREAVRRLESCRNVSALARELGIRRKYLYKWQAAFQQRGEQGLRSRPVKAAPPKPGAAALPTPPRETRQRVAELERLLGEKQLEVDFFRRTFEHVRGALPRTANDGGTPSTMESGPDSSSKDRT
jgi:transposase-like protein